MEATGVYWIPVYDILEARGLDVLLVNARHVKPLLVVTCVERDTNDLAVVPVHDVLVGVGRVRPIDRALESTALG